LENETTKGSSEGTAVVTPSSGKGESIEKTAAEGLLLAAESELGGPHAQVLELDGPSPDLFTSQCKAAGLQPQSSADLQYAWLYEAAKTRISPTDYVSDSEFYPMYLYLTEGKLVGSNETDKKTLLLADQYVILDGLLYRMQLPKSKCSAVDVAIVQRLCVPRLFRLYILHFVHDSMGHFAEKRVYAAMYSRFNWQSVYSDLVKYVQSCDLCLKAKPYRSSRRVPLNPLTIPEGSFIRVGVDFKDFPKKTPSGFVAVMVCMDIFSGLVRLIPVKDMSTETANKAFIQGWICHFSIPLEIQSDRGSNLTAKVFESMLQQFGIKHYINASRSPRANGAIEAQVKRFTELVKRLCECDSQIEDVLPIVEFILNSTPQAKMRYSPFKIIYGHPPRICEIEQLKPAI